eukprot:3255844-Alexandrium_andersonii.AAC.1
MKFMPNSPAVALLGERLVGRGHVILDERQARVGSNLDLFAVQVHARRWGGVTTVSHAQSCINYASRRVEHH